MLQIAIWAQCHDAPRMQVADRPIASAIYVSASR